MRVRIHFSATECFVLHLYIFRPIDAKIVSCLFRVSSRDTGKTMVDASLGEIMTTCEKITWLLSEGERWLKPEYRYFHNILFKFQFYL